MEKNDNADIEIPEEENLGALDDSTDWKLKADELQKKHREAGIRNRERTKALKDRITELEKSPPQPTVKKEEKPDEFGLLQKTYLRSAGVVDEDEIELAKSIQKKTGLDWDKLPDDDYFKSKLEGLRTAKSNANAVSNVRGGSGGTETKNTPEYWIAKGTPPTAEQVSDKKTRVKIYRAMMAQQESGGKFYNE